MIQRRFALAGLLAAPAVLRAEALGAFEPTHRWVTRAVMDFRRYLTAAEADAHRLRGEHTQGHAEAPKDERLYFDARGKPYPLLSFRAIEPGDLSGKTALYEPRAGGVWLAAGERWMPPAECEYFASSLRPLILWPSNQRFTDLLDGGRSAA